METASGGVNWHSGKAFLPMQRVRLVAAGAVRAEDSLVGRPPVIRLTRQMDCVFVWLALLRRERLHQFLMGRCQADSRFISHTNTWNQVLFRLSQPAKLRLQVIDTGLCLSWRFT